MTDLFVLAHARDLPDTFQDRQPIQRQLLQDSGNRPPDLAPDSPQFPTRSPSVYPTFELIASWPKPNSEAIAASSNHGKRTPGFAHLLRTNDISLFLAAQYGRVIRLISMPGRRDHFLVDLVSRRWAIQLHRNTSTSKTRGAYHVMMEPPLPKRLLRSIHFFSEEARRCGRFDADTRMDCEAGNYIERLVYVLEWLIVPRFD
jgi:hypothetical protein